MKLLIAAAIAATSLCVLPSVAAADTQRNDEIYGNIGVANFNTDDLSLEAVGARVGYRFNRYIGVEVEGAVGISEDSAIVDVPPPIQIDFKLDHEIAAYVVGSVPVSDNVRLFARVGYGTQQFSGSSGGISADADDESINAGVGGRWTWDGRNGVQLDYTHHDFQDGGDADVFALTYVRVFR